MPHLVGIGLTELPISGGAKVPSAPPLTTALHNICASYKLFENSNVRHMNWATQKATLPPSPLLAYPLPPVP